ncbi:MAG: hypothetical protein U1E36_01735 [Rickettsiales bacterium]
MVYVCNCHGIGEKAADEAIHKAAEKGDALPRDVLAEEGKVSKCGKCIKDILERTVRVRGVQELKEKPKWQRYLRKNGYIDENGQVLKDDRGKPNSVSGFSRG